MATWERDAEASMFLGGSSCSQNFLQPMTVAGNVRFDVPMQHGFLVEGGQQGSRSAVVFSSPMAFPFTFSSIAIKAPSSSATSECYPSTNWTLGLVSRSMIATPPP
jgi:hypothetical protein